MEKEGQSLSSILLWDSESGMEKKSESGLNNPDPEHWDDWKSQKTLDIPFYMYIKYLDGLLWLEYRRQKLANLYCMYVHGWYSHCTIWQCIEK